MSSHPPPSPWSQFCGRTGQLHLRSQARCLVCGAVNPQHDAVDLTQVHIAKKHTRPSPRCHFCRQAAAPSTSNPACSSLDARTSAYHMLATRPMDGSERHPSLSTSRPPKALTGTSDTFGTSPRHLLDRNKRWDSALIVCSLASAATSTHSRTPLSWATPYRSNRKVETITGSARTPRVPAAKASARRLLGTASLSAGEPPHTANNLQSKHTGRWLRSIAWM